MFDPWASIGEVLVSVFILGLLISAALLLLFTFLFYSNEVKYHQAIKVYKTVIEQKRDLNTKQEKASPYGPDSWGDGADGE